jgi:hypothetical protein
MNSVERLEIKDRKTFKNIVDVRFRIAMPNDNELPRSRAARYQNEFLSY